MKILVHLQTLLAEAKRDDRGAGLAEYALLLILVAVASVGLLGLFVADLTTAFDNMGNQIAP